jgi:hypothetical protein
MPSGSFHPDFDLGAGKQVAHLKVNSSYDVGDVATGEAVN